MRVIIKSSILLMAIFFAVGCAGVKKVTQTTGEAPPPTPTAVIAPSSDKTITLAFTGDIMMADSAAYKLKTEGPDSFFTYTAPLLKQADIAMGNLEGPLGLKGKKVKGKKYTFLVAPSCALGLAHAGYKLLTLANNHTMDYGPMALQSTIAALESQKLQHTGAGMNNAEARQPAWFDLKGRKVAVLAYSNTIPAKYWATDKRPGCAPAYADEMREDIKAARDKGANLVIVCCHWGQEKKTTLRYYQPQLAHMAIEAGADAVVGHHPHIWQGLEVYQGKPIAYAIGNFCFGTLTPIKDSGILYLSFDEKNRWGGGKIVPLNVNNYQVQFAAQPMQPKAAKSFYNYLTKLSKNVDLSYADDSFTWKAPDVTVTPVSTPIASPTPTESIIKNGSSKKRMTSPTPFEGTPTPEPRDNPNGSLPGVKKP